MLTKDKVAEVLKTQVAVNAAVMRMADPDDLRQLIDAERAGANRGYILKRIYQRVFEVRRKAELARLAAELNGDAG